MGGLGTTLRHCRYPGFRVWLLFWIWLRQLVLGLRVFLMPFFAMIPQVDGDSTPLGQRPLSVLPVVYRLWDSLRLGHLWEWVAGWLPKSVYSFGNGLSSVEAWFSTALDIEEVLSGTGGDQLHVVVADVIKSFDTVGQVHTGLCFGAAGIGLTGFVKVYFSFHKVRFVSSSRLLLDLVNRGVGTVVFPQGCPLSMVYVHCCLVCPVVSSS